MLTQLSIQILYLHCCRQILIDLVQKIKFQRKICTPLTLPMSEIALNVSGHLNKLLNEVRTCCCLLYV